MTPTIDKIALIVLRGRKILATRSRGKDIYYLPGGKREPGESDLDTLTREIAEELTVAVVPATAVRFGTYEAPADGRSDGTRVRATYYTADYLGTPTAAGEIEKIAWLTYADRDRLGSAAQLLFEDLNRTGLLT
ncbi:NUDIX domain-containing protein [Actinoallomurus acanthiterrae]